MTRYKELAIYLRKKKCERMLDLAGLEPFQIHPVEWHHLSVSEQEEYIEVARNALEWVSKEDKNDRNP